VAAILDFWLTQKRFLQGTIQLLFLSLCLSQVSSYWENVFFHFFTRPYVKNLSCGGCHFGFLMDKKNTKWVTNWVVHILQLIQAYYQYSAGLHPTLYNTKKGALAAASDKVYQLLAQERWFSPGTTASSTTKTGRHDIVEIHCKKMIIVITKTQMRQLPCVPHW
jgi:hypothetical protein